MFKSRRMRWAGHVARVEERRDTYKVLVGRPEDLGVDVRIKLKWIFKKQEGARGLDWSVSGCGQMAGCCEHGNEPSYCIKCGEFVD
jgi:hypothetical protein